MNVSKHNETGDSSRLCEVDTKCFFVILKCFYGAVYGANGGSMTTNTAADGSVTSSVRFVDGGAKSSTDQVGNVTSFDKGTHSLSGGGRLGGVSTSYPAAASPDFAYGYVAKSGGLLETVTGPAHKVTNSYEATRNVLDVKTNATLGGSPVTLSAFDYGVNDLSQRDDVDVSGTAFVAPYTRGFKYDAKGQVVSDDHSTDNAKDRAFEFDGIGNRLKSSDSLTLPASNNYATNALNQYSTALGVARPVASHDDDGNLVDDGVKTYVWDGENRLLSVSDSSGVLVSYTYDYLSRRITKNETSGSNVTFVYDGWNPVAVYGGSGLSKTYTWGMDLSGSMQGAGGVGGLLAVKETSSGGSYYPTYDGNGNVSEYLDSTGVVVAHYEYDAFGRTTMSSGTKKDDFVHRFSTKQLDDACGLYYYGYRYYQPRVGRWLGRDPIEEKGGLNLFGFVYNSSVNGFDILGGRPQMDSISQSMIQAASRGDLKTLQHLVQISKAGGRRISPQATRALREIAKRKGQNGKGRSGGRPAGASQRIGTRAKKESKKKCLCECISDIESFDKGKSNYDSLYSWNFNIQVLREVFESNSPEDSGQVQLEWNETSNRLPAVYKDYIDPAQPNTIDLVKTPLYGRSSVFENWRSRSRIPGMEVNTFDDTPEVDLKKYGPRTLGINVIFKNPECCLKRGFKGTFQVNAYHDVDDFGNGDVYHYGKVKSHRF